MICGYVSENGICHRHGPVNRGNDRENDYDDYPVDLGVPKFSTNHISHEIFGLAMETPSFFPASKPTQKVRRYGCDRPLPVGFDGTYISYTIWPPNS